MWAKQGPTITLTDPPGHLAVHYAGPYRLITKPMSHDLGFPRPDSRLIETDTGIPPAESTPVSQQGLPEDLLREAAQRLAYTCLISGGLWLANWLVVHLIHPLPGTFRPEEMALHVRWAQVFDWVGVRPLGW